MVTIEIVEVAGGYAIRKRTETVLKTKFEYFDTDDWEFREGEFDEFDAVIETPEDALEMLEAAKEQQQAKNPKMKIISENDLKVDVAQRKISGANEIEITEEDDDDDDDEDDKDWLKETKRIKDLLDKVKKQKNDDLRQKFYQTRWKDYMFEKMSDDFEIARKKRNL